MRLAQQVGVMLLNYILYTKNLTDKEIQDLTNEFYDLCQEQNHEGLEKFRGKLRG